MNVRVLAPRLIIGTVTVAIAIAAYALLASPDTKPPDLGPFASVPTTPGEAPVTTAGPVRPRIEYDLATVLITGIDVSFQPADPGRYPQGPLDAAAAARLEPNPSVERDRLASDGFQRGYQRAWTTTASDLIGAAVYQFRDEAGAQRYLSDGASTVLRQGAEEFAVQIEGAHGFTQVDDAMTIHTVAFGRGPFFFLFFAASEHAAVTRDRLVEVAITQRDRLP